MERIPPDRCQRDYIVAIISAVVIGLMDWFTIPAMGFSETMKWMGILTELALGIRNLVVDPGCQTKPLIPLFLGIMKSTPTNIPAFDPKPLGKIEKAAWLIYAAVLVLYNTLLCCFYTNFRRKIKER